MAIKTELSADRERGAGYGQLRVSGLGGGGESIDFSLMRNQGNQPFLGKGGMWQATEAWHSAADVFADGDALVIPVGPDIVDPIVSQPANVAYRLTVAAGTSKQASTLKVNRPLLGSGAAAPDETVTLEQQRREEAARRAREEEERRRREEEEEARRRAAEAEAQRLREEADKTVVQPPPQPVTPPEQETVPPPVEEKKRWPLIAGLLALLIVAGGGAGAWFGCLIEGFGPASCKTEEVVKPEPCGPDGGPPGCVPGTPKPPDVVSPPSTETALSCAGLTDGAACLQVAQKALERKQLEPARQLLQQAAAMGSVEANLAVARMYDPDTWAAESSPVAKPSWETAVFWYEKAARQGNLDGQLAAGRLLCKNALTEFEKTQGRGYLEQAAKAGSADAQTLLAGCK